MACRKSGFDSLYLHEMAGRTKRYLTDVERDEIRCRAAQGDRHADIAVQFDVSAVTVFHTIHGRSRRPRWPPRSLTRIECEAIRVRLQAGESRVALAEDFETSVKAISNIVRARSANGSTSASHAESEGSTPSVSTRG